MDKIRIATRTPAGLTGTLAPVLAGALLAGCASTQVAVDDPYDAIAHGRTRGTSQASSTATLRPAAATAPTDSADSAAAPAAGGAAHSGLPSGTATAGAAEQPAAPGAVATPMQVEQGPDPARAEPAAAPAYRDLWARMRAGFAMPELDTPLVADKERFYLQRPEDLQRMFERGGRYLYFIIEELEKRGMPTELALLPFVESAMNPRALSSAQAAGLWQFIPSTGKQYNLSQNWWVDNRRDVVQSTRAALEYLQYIYELQGSDWFLALASYNWGEGSVQRAVRKNAARGLPTDYLSLSMPDETRHYVPKLIALKHIVLHADELGIALPPVPNKPYFVTVEKTRPIDLKLAAKFAGMSVDEFVALNPAHNRPVIAASRNNQIKLPIDRIDAFLDAVDRHRRSARPLASWQPYTLQPGESLDHLAARAGTTVHEIKQANGLQQSTHRILPGTRLLAPQPDATDESQLESFVAPRVYEAVDRPAAYHKVGKTESVATIAQRYGVTAAALRTWNNIKASIRRGMTLLVRPAATQTVLTTESGDRQVVATAVHGVPAAPAPEPAAASEDARPMRADLRAADAARTDAGAAQALGTVARAAAARSAGRPQPAQAARHTPSAPAFAAVAAHVTVRVAKAGAVPASCRAPKRASCEPSQAAQAAQADRPRVRVTQPPARARSAASSAHAVPARAARNAPVASAGRAQPAAGKAAAGRPATAPEVRADARRERGA